jgi:hypothetical protein
MLAPRGKGRTWVLAGMGAYEFLGVALLTFGLAALVTGQPYAIWYWPTLTGGLFAVLFGVLTPTVRRRYAEAEQRRLESEALRHG